MVIPEPVSKTPRMVAKCFQEEFLFLGPIGNKRWGNRSVIATASVLEGFVCSTEVTTGTRLVMANVVGACGSCFSTRDRRFLLGAVLLPALLWRCSAFWSRCLRFRGVVDMYSGIRGVSDVSRLCESVSEASSNISAVVDVSSETIESLFWIEEE